jgi:hypothetical protein
MLLCASFREQDGAPRTKEARAARTKGAFIVILRYFHQPIVLKESRMIRPAYKESAGGGERGRIGK